MTTTRIFNRFRPHETGTVVTYDAEAKMLRYMRDEGGESCLALQTGLDFDTTTLLPGARVRLQIGKMTNHSSTMRGGARYYRYGNRTVRQQMYTGCECISAIAHIVPKVSLLGLRAMEHYFGPQDAADHLRHYGACASTLQTEINHGNGSRYRLSTRSIEIRISKGVLHAGTKLHEHLDLNMYGLVFPAGDLPESVATALIGRPFSTIVAHPAIMDDDLVIERLHDHGTGSWTAFPCDVHLTVDQAIARLFPPLAKAA